MVNFQSRVASPLRNFFSRLTPGLTFNHFQVGTLRRPPVLPPVPAVLDAARLQDGAADDVRRIEAVAGQGGRHHKSVRVPGPGGLHRGVAAGTAPDPEVTLVVFQLVAKVSAFDF